MAIVSNTVGYLDGDVALEGFFAYDDAIDGPRPVVLIHHAWGGRDGFVAEKAKLLAERGYLGFAADTYGRGVLGKSPEENAGLMQPFMADRAKLQKRLHAALAAAKLLPWADNGKIAAIGFCFGGLCALDLARSGADIRGVVSFHGLLVPPDNIPEPRLKAKVLVLHGHDDPMAPPAQVQALQAELSRAGADWQVHSYGNTMHAFTNPVANNPSFGTVYQALADRRSWQAMQNFLAEIFA
ncbi:MULTISPECIES: dienelactone hydrolase family protein [Methylomonas]|uniref:Carboxymethylenebutenolidase n=1 Tax=Methylomonas koyamae TaxID=702114 RepID=A0A291IJ86_9GAMM|nr:MULTISPECIES: dienelactone hydrolase family protein [Methylomonas]ANE55492.1 carboxymethylenebutenolidase [Methylomonas sp. DH-1]ATG90354.1 carboxymethylenebutenolidase [Methylomonas koyamae]OAI26668.1 carboxymethylenebutenolidase [Methylomonas koyamae]